MANQIFSIVNPLALVGWFFLAAFRGRPWATWVAGRLLPALLSGVYAVIVTITFWHTEGGFSSLDEVAELFSDRYLLLAGWVHYLAFDLLVGSWIVEDAKKQCIPHLWLLPVLFLTFMFGPVGWLAYLTTRGLAPLLRSKTPEQTERPPGIP